MARTTVTLEPDVDQAIRRWALERGTTFKSALNQLIRAGLGSQLQSEVEFVPPTLDLGVRTDLSPAELKAMAEEELDEIWSSR